MAKQIKESDDNVESVDINFFDKHISVNYLSPDTDTELYVFSMDSENNFYCFYYFVDNLLSFYVLYEKDLNYSNDEVKNIVADITNKDENFGILLS